MEKLRVLIVEDPSYVEIALESRLKEMNFEVVGQVVKPSDALGLMEVERIDLVLTDVFLSENYTGLDLLIDIEKKFSIPVILICGDENFNLDGLRDYSANALLYKPLNDNELAYCMRSACALPNSTVANSRAVLERSKSYIFVRADYRLNKIRVNDIYYLEAKKDYVTIHTTDNVYTVHATMKDMEAILPDDLFIRTHRSYIVNIDKVFSIKYPDILIEHKMKTIQIGGLYRKQLFNKINVV